MSIEWNRDFENELKRAMQPALKEFARKHQPKMDAFTRKYKERPVDEVARALQREIKSWGGSAPDRAELTQWATAISKGERVILKPAA
ncbi:hypothetical protein [Mycobacteroides abscessus]|uniref:hypothetical protein n=1 Tax=Mycobacteroides abscessus TaxID=36809 RepID=UPI000C26BCDE|nr:hypothetical protein [Mycobacteroides abscessus]